MNSRRARLGGGNGVSLRVLLGVRQVVDSESWVLLASESVVLSDPK